jgi:hypothetical protein
LCKSGVADRGRQYWRRARCAARTPTGPPDRQRASPAGAVGFQLALWIPFGSFVVASLILLAAPIRGERDLPTRRTEASELAGTIGA